MSYHHVSPQVNNYLFNLTSPHEQRNLSDTCDSFSSSVAHKGLFRCMMLLISDYLAIWTVPEFELDQLNAKFEIVTQWDLAKCLLTTSGSNLIHHQFVLCSAAHRKTSRELVYKPSGSTLHNVRHGRIRHGRFRGRPEHGRDAASGDDAGDADGGFVAYVQWACNALFWQLR